MYSNRARPTHPHLTRPGTRHRLRHPVETVAIRSDTWRAPQTEPPAVQTDRRRRPLPARRAARPSSFGRSQRDLPTRRVPEGDAEKREEHDLRREKSTKYLSLRVFGQFCRCCSYVGEPGDRPLAKDRTIFHKLRR